jgi:hypothetical protein
MSTKTEQKLDVIEMLEAKMSVGILLLFHFIFYLVKKPFWMNFLNDTKMASDFCPGMSNTIAVLGTLCF